MIHLEYGVRDVSTVEMNDQYNHLMCQCTQGLYMTIPGC